MTAAAWFSGKRTSCRDLLWIASAMCFPCRCSRWGWSGIRRNSWTASSRCCGSDSSRSPASMKEMMSRSVSWRGCSSTRASIALRCWIRRQRRHWWISWRTASAIRSMWRTGRRRASSLTRNSIVSRRRRSARVAMSSTASRTRALSH